MPTVQPEAAVPESAPPPPAPAAASAAADGTSGVRRGLLRFRPYVRGADRYWILVVLATVVTAATEPLVPAMLKPLLDRGFQSATFNPWLVPAALLLVFGIRGLSGFITDVALAKIANEGMFSLRQALFARVLDARPDLFLAESASSLANSIVHEVQGATVTLINAVTGLAKDGLAVVFLLAYLVYLNPLLTLVVLGVAPAVGWLMRTASRRLHSLAKSSQAATIDLAYAVEENVLANRIVRLHEAQRAQGGRFEALNRRLRSLAMKTSVASAAITPLMHLLSASALSVVICIALWQKDQGMTIGGFAAFVTAMLMLIAPVKRLSEVAGPITRALALLERSFDLVDHSAAESGGSFDPGRAAGRIELRDVAVTYPGAAQPALDGIRLAVEPGETLALVGPSGGGKTTLAWLLTRFVEPVRGTVLLDDRDVREWDLRALRRQFAMVSQNVVMFNTTLAENVALGETVDRERVLRALEAAHLGELVAQLPRGIDTQLGHNGEGLSGGQRQRVAIARALYKDAPILVLDEATSALDNASERLVQDALRRLRAGRTSLIVAHRLSTVEHADRIAVLERGKLVELGTQAELLARGGLYARLRALGDAGPLAS